MSGFFLQDYMMGLVRCPLYETPTRQTMGDFLQDYIMGLVRHPLCIQTLTRQTIGIFFRLHNGISPPSIVYRRPLGDNTQWD